PRVQVVPSRTRLLLYSSFFFSCYAPRRALHSFPTRRSSDLSSASCGATPRGRDDEPRRPAGRRRPGDRRAVRRLRAPLAPGAQRSEEHTSELQSQSNLVCRLLLEKKKKKTNKINSLQTDTRN